MPEQEFRTRPDGTVYPLTPRKGKGGAGIVVAALLAVGLIAANGGMHNATLVSTTTDPTWHGLPVRQQDATAPQHPDCVAQSHDQVRQFFVRTPCAGMTEALYTLVDRSGNTFALSVAWVRMSSAADAVAFQKLDDTYGTGDITALGGIRLTGQHYRSAIDGTLVVIAEAEPLTGQSTLLDDAALTGTQLPAP
ncbi:hypothetical protein BCF44_12378 [Kutzneria buriramensis]|uniref:Uncharacterized protein n=1 Tax=Kutzneria buriramensis TaxID=1045776 RepID=A0A3E0GVM7_9PSEU|nr:hypothetical protein BCF44_12378 [Kutzneria buriramensis]